MKNTIYFLTTLLGLWIAGCSYYYVCKIRMDCGAVKSQMAADVNQAVMPDTLVGVKTEEQLSPPPPYVILFRLGISTCVPAPEDKNHFSLVKQYVTDNPGARVAITGHADNTGSESLNMKLSIQRAEFIRQQLLETGIMADHMDLSGKGEHEPVSENNSDEGRTKNRRVEIQTYKN